MKKVRKEMREVAVEDYYAEVGDVITIPRRPGKFVVEEARMTGGGSAQGGDVYPDAWHVKARKLDDDEYKPETKLVKFTQHTNCYNNVIEGVKQIGQMKKVIDFQWIRSW